MRSIIEEEYKDYLTNIASTDLLSASLLDLHHQTVIRIGRISEKLSLRNIVTYFGDEVFRYKLLENLKSYYRVERNDRPIQTTVAAGSGLKSHENRWRHFKLLSETCADNEFFSFANEYGFGLFNVEGTEVKEGVALTTVSYPYAASIGAMMYYGFSIGEKDKSYLIKPSLDVLVETLNCYRVYGVPAATGARRREEMIAKELKDISGKNDLSEAVFAMIINHEIGHHKYFVRPPLNEIFDQLMIGEDAQYLPNFISKADLGAWDRIKNGYGTISDTIFLIGDFLANVSTIPPEANSHVSVLRAFHWWLLRPASYFRRPRAVSWLLCLTENGRLDGKLLSTILVELFSIAKQKPQYILETLLKWENFCWNNLKIKYKLADVDM